VETARSAERIAAARQRGVALHEIAVLCTTNELCRRAVEALRRSGVPAYFRNTDDYRLTPCTALVEGCVAWAAGAARQATTGWVRCCGNGVQSRAQDTLANRTQRRPSRVRARSSSRPAAAASSSAAPASARNVHVVLGFQSDHQRILSDIGNGLEAGQGALH
jgi:hypothetical protein